jgi:CheY-like chemotaxis protein
VEMMGGEIGVLSQKGKGTHFWFVLSFKKNRQIAKTMANKNADSQSLSGTSGAAEKSTAGELFEDKLVLIVEDNKVLQGLLVRQLASAGVRTQVVSNGLEAIEAVQGLDFDLIFMDCQLPQMDGFAATNAIRQFESKRGKHTPIIALTAGAMEGDRQKCLAAGMDDYLSKPTNVGQLAQKLEMWIPLKQTRQN